MKRNKERKRAKKAKKQAPPKPVQARSKVARAHIAEGTRLFALAGRPTKAQFVKVYGPQGPKMTWEQRAKAGVDAGPCPRSALGDRASCHSLAHCESRQSRAPVSDRAQVARRRTRW